MSVDSHLYRAHGDDLLSSNDASRRPPPRRPLARMAFRHPGLAICNPEVSLSVTATTLCPGAGREERHVTRIA
jgi:hypothetical protein